MLHTEIPFQHQYLRQLQVNLLIAEYTHVDTTWKENNITNTFNKFYLIESGEGVITIDQTTYHPKAGDWIFIPSGSVVSFSAISSKTYLKQWCHFSANIGASPLTDYFKIPIISQPFNYPEVSAAFKRLIDAYKSPSPYAPVLYHSRLLDLIYTFFEVNTGNIKLKQPVTQTKIHILLEYIMEHLEDKITIDTLATYMNLHPNYLIRLFKSTFGIAPMEYVNLQRIERAKTLLRLPDASVSSVSNQLGFTTPYYFSAVFKRVTGLSPKQFRSYH